MYVDNLVESIKTLSHADFLRFQSLMRNRLSLDVVLLERACLSPVNGDVDMVQHDECEDLSLPSWHVIMTGYNDRKIQTIKLIRDCVSGLSLREAVDMCNTVSLVPGMTEVTIKHGLTYNEAMNLQQALQDSGINCHMALR